MLMNEVLASFRVTPVYLKEGSTKLGNWVLRKFQEDVREAIISREDAIVTAVTGGGKTASLLLGDNGFVGLYPNNTLLLDQQRSLDRILGQALNAELTLRREHSEPSIEEKVDVLRIYEVKTHSGELPINKLKKVAVVLLSGRYIGYEYDENGRLIPKRVVILREVIEELQRQRDIYVITLATPDTALMIMTGIYRSFENVGYALHNAMLSSLEGESIEWTLSKYGVATVEELGDLAVIRQYLLKYPWFIDEFHLYGDYEASLLLPVLKVYREQVGWDYPIILSSATPSGSLYAKVVEYLKPKEIRGMLLKEGSSNAFVRGETEVEIVAVSSYGRGLVKWINTGFAVPNIVNERVNEIKKIMEAGGRVFIVVDRVNQVPPIVETLSKYGIYSECSVAVKPVGCSKREELLVVGSESISQGIDRTNVRYGIISAYNVISLIQRFGRIGRKTDSKVLLIVPRTGKKLRVEDLDGRSVSYEDFSKKVAETYSDVMISELMESKELENFYEKRSKLVEIATTIGYAQVSKPRGTFEKLSKILRDSRELLDMFYGQPEAIAKALMFRSSGFPVLVEKPDGEQEVADVGVVLRNFNVKEVDTVKSKEGCKKKMLLLRIDLEPGRAQLFMELGSGSKVKEGIAERLNGTITSIGELATLGFTLKVKTFNEFGGEKEISSLSPSEILEVQDIREQALVILKLPDEHVEFYAYTVRGVKIGTGMKWMLGLFI